MIGLCHKKDLFSNTVIDFSGFSQSMDFMQDFFTDKNENMKLEMCIIPYLPLKKEPYICFLCLSNSSSSWRIQSCEYCVKISTTPIP